MEKTIILNGIPLSLSVEPAGTLSSLLEEIQVNVKRNDHVVVSTKIDDIEVTDANRDDLSGLSLQTVGKVEVRTSSLQEVALETIESMGEFLDQINDYCVQLIQVKDETKFNHDFRALIDGIQTFVEAVGSVRRVFKIGKHPKIALLDADLESLLEDLVEACESGNTAFRNELLSRHLPKNLAEWKKEGIDLLKPAGEAPQPDRRSL